MFLAYKSGSVSSHNNVHEEQGTHDSESGTIWTLDDIPSQFRYHVILAPSPRSVGVKRETRQPILAAALVPMLPMLPMPEAVQLLVFELRADPRLV